MKGVESAELTFIGQVRSPCNDKGEVPKNYSESETPGILEIYPEYQEGLENICAGQTIVVLFWLHEAQRDTLRVHPRGDRSRKLQGVFATRSPNRPNPIGLSELFVTRREGLQIHVSNLDMINNTPILDIKKKIA